MCWPLLSEVFMRCRVCVAVLLFAGLAVSQTTPVKAGLPVAAQTGCTSNDETALRQVSVQWKDAYNNKDAARVASLYTDDAYYLTQHFVDGIVHPRANIQAYVQRGVDAGYLVDSIEILVLTCVGDLSYTITRYRSTNGPDKAMGVNLVVLRKLEGKWRIVAHEAAVPDPATAVQTLNPVKPN
jgi:uncharacterized protein (TIGR02246 family)